MTEDAELHYQLLFPVNSLLSGIPLRKEMFPLRFNFIIVLCEWIVSFFSSSNFLKICIAIAHFIDKLSFLITVTFLRSHDGLR